jgi:hypothetical protein
VTKHTPGPWRKIRTGDGKRYVIGEGQSKWGTEVAEVYADDTDPEEAKANACLIQRAPEMLDVLEDVSEYLDGYADIDDQGGPNRAMRLMQRIEEVLK